MESAVSTVNSDARSAGARSVVYKALAEGFDYPTEDGFGFARHGKVAAILRQAVLEAGFGQETEIEAALQLLDDAARDLGTTVRLIDLEVEFNRLFAPTDVELRCPPFESVIRELGLGEKVNNLADVMGFYRAWGLDVSDERQEFPDNIVTELEFLHFLAYKELNAIQLNEQEHAERTNESQRSFMQDHASLWIGRFCERVAQTTECDWYRGLARFTQAFVAADGARLGSL